MRVAVVGAGAIGGMVGGKLALSGCDVTLIARGAHLAALRRDGLHLEMTAADGGRLHVPAIAATDDIAAAGPHDVVILALKAHQIAAVAKAMPALYGPETIVLTMQNGIPWWYFQRHGGPFDGRRIDCLDPDGLLTVNIPAARIIGCIAYPAATIAAPGVIRQVEGNRFPVGELDGSDSPRVRRVSEMLEAAGFKSRVLTDIRSEIWLKAWGNLAFNPISAMTHATLEDMCRFAPTRSLAQMMMEEAQAVATKLGITFRVGIDRRIAGAEAVGAHKTSMLQDVESGRELETEALVGAVAELARLTETRTPHIDAVLACTRLLGETLRRSGGTVQLAAAATPVTAPGAKPAGEAPATCPLHR